MTVFQILQLCGLGTLSSLIITDIVVRVRSYFERKRAARDQSEKDSQAMKKGIQAQLRATMINDYNYWKSRGYAPVYARENFENVYRNYHDLGANGVMDDIHDKFFALPVTKTTKTKN